MKDEIKMTIVILIIIGLVVGMLFSLKSLKNKDYDNTPEEQEVKEEIKEDKKEEVIEESKPEEKKETPSKKNSTTNKTTSTKTETKTTNNPDDPNKYYKTINCKLEELEAEYTTHINYRGEFPAYKDKEFSNDTELENSAIDFYIRIKDYKISEEKEKQIVDELFGDVQKSNSGYRLLNKNNNEE